MPVLYGVLMYMGVASLKGMQFVDRIGLLFMPPKYQPDYSYLRHVPIKKVHLFTFIQASFQRPPQKFKKSRRTYFLQVLALAILWILKSTDASLIFPLMVLALVLFRKVMDYFPKVFSQQDLLWLDNLMPSSGDKKDEETEQESVEENKNVRKRFITFPKLWKVENELETNHINNVTLLKK